jgi:hypothetical protein
MKTPDDVLLDELNDPRFEWRNGKFVLKDKNSFRVPMRMMDSKTNKLADGLVASGHRNGWRISKSSQTDAARAERQRLYDEYDAAVESQFTGFGSTPSTRLRGDQPGDVCTIDGWPGHLRNVNGRLTCVADDKSATDAPRRKRKTQYRDPEGREEGTAEAEEDLVGDAKKARDTAYAAYEKDLTTAWSRPIDETPVNNPRPANTARRVNDTVQAAYADYDKDLANEWRRG